MHYITRKDEGEKKGERKREEKGRQRKQNMIDEVEAYAPEACLAAAAAF
jgi:hypothetical protein